MIDVDKLAHSGATVVASTTPADDMQVVTPIVSEQDAGPTGVSLKVVHVCTKDSGGGAAGSMYRLHDSLRQRGVQSSILARHANRSDPSTIQFKPSMDVRTRISRRIRRAQLQYFEAPVQTDHGPFSSDRTQYGRDVVRQIPDCDVVTLHWVAWFVDYESFFRHLPKHIPVVWRLSDLNPITGGCHYDAGCGRYLTGCFACPQLGSSERNDLSRRIWRRKKRLFSQLDANRLHFVAQSRWIESCISRSDLTGRFGVSVIANGVDLDVFKPGNAEEQRRSLGISADQKVVLFVSASIESPRKGFDVLLEALRGLEADSGIVLVSVGNPDGKFVIPIQLPHIHLGRINEERHLAEIYRMADLFVIPSLEDNLPNTALEALACGTPVIGFNTGGIRDIVRQGETGHLVPVGSSSGLRAALFAALEDDEARRRMALECREVALSDFDLNRQSGKYVSLYQELCLR